MPTGKNKEYLRKTPVDVQGEDITIKMYGRSDNIADKYTTRMAAKRANRDSHARLTKTQSYR